MTSRPSPDWRIPAASLRLAAGAPTVLQLHLATTYRVPFTARDSRAVLAARLADALGHTLDLGSPVPASDRQRSYLGALGYRDPGAADDLSRRVASAWIRTLLARQTADVLERLRPSRGDLVVYRPRHASAESAEPPELTAVVSSISETGRINLRRHAGTRSVWPSQVRNLVRQPRVVAGR